MGINIKLSTYILIILLGVVSCKKDQILKIKEFESVGKRNHYFSDTLFIVSKKSIFYRIDSLLMSDIIPPENNIFNIKILKQDSFYNKNYKQYFFTIHSTSNLNSYYGLFEKDHGTIFFTNTETHSKFILKKINSNSLEPSDPIYKYIDSVTSPPPYQEELFDNTTEEIDTIILDENLLIR
ncbi:hypothetical protein [Flammeovirga sp. EKP202]|uniref:hypothetical protein n=1 Tax=Flammeovirga sp. EKP202 TaxID=2770592 RepID=UPI00165F5D79|nr:hypothetical protein [Flammeovirga sp. EKP202]MBD0401902.1 hypothetical protein [Flammeovirga sp. EKP202]